MKKLVYLLDILVLIVALASCSADYDEPEQPTTRQNETPADSTVVNPRNDSTEVYKVISTVPVSDDVKQFFDEALPSPDIYGNVGETDFLMDAEQYSDRAGLPVYHVINNQKEFQERYIGKDTLPEIAFDDYTLIIGHCLTGTPSSVAPYYFGINIYQFNDHNEVNIIEQNYHYYGGAHYSFFWGVFPKVKGIFKGFRWNDENGIN